MDYLHPLLAAYLPQLILAVVLLYVLYLSINSYPERQNILLLGLGYLVYGLLNWQHLLILVVVTAVTFAAGLRWVEMAQSEACYWAASSSC